MSGLTSSPVRTARLLLQGLRGLLHELLTGLENTGVVRSEQERVNRRRRMSLHRHNHLRPLRRHIGVLLVHRDEVPPRARMRNVIVLRVKSLERRAVALGLEVLLDLVPWRAADVLQDD